MFDGILSKSVVSQLSQLTKMFDYIAVELKFYVDISLTVWPIVLGFLTCLNDQNESKCSTTIQAIG